MWTRRSAAVVLVAATLTACATTEPQHESMTAPDANLPAYRTFGWRAPPAEGADAGALRILDVNIQAAIRAELTGRGYLEDKEAPQLLITWETQAVEKTKSNPVRVGIGLGGFSGNMGGSVGVGSPGTRDVREGTLVIHAIDAAANREVWYGTVSGELDRKAVDAATVARAVAIAMQAFPRRAAAVTAPPPP